MWNKGIIFSSKLKIINCCCRFFLNSNSTGLKSLNKFRLNIGVQTMSKQQEDILENFLDQELNRDEADNLNEAVMGYNPRDEAETCKNLRPDGTCYRGKKCKWRHNILKNGFTTDKEEIYSSAFVELSLPKAGNNVNIVITHIVDISCFYAQLKYEYDKESANEQLIRIMNTPENQRTYKKFKQIPSINQMVITKYFNNRWYRGLVRNIGALSEKNSTTMCEVFLVDYGEVIEMPLSDLRVIVPQFLHIPFQAIECRLCNVKHKTGKDKADEKYHFECQYLGQTVKAHVIAMQGHLQLHLQNNKGEDIGLKFIEAGYGELNTEYNFPDNELMLID